MQPALDSLKIPILREVKIAGRDKFRKHQSPEKQKNLQYMYCWSILLCSSEEPTESNAYVQFWVTLILNFFVRKDFIVQKHRKLQKKKPCPIQILFKEIYKRYISKSYIIPVKSTQIMKFPIA